jgi:hypothetical protein
MADQKISQLTGATTPLAGTEVLPIVQSGATRKVSVANLTAGRSTSVSELKVITANGQTNIVAGNTAGGNKIQAWNAAGNSDGYLGIEGFNIAYGQFTTAGNWAPANGLGIDFSADPSAAGMTSELLDDYEEGTWTPADASGAGLAITVNQANYTKVGNLVTAQFYIAYPTNSNVGGAAITLPFVPKNIFQQVSIGYTTSVVRFGAVNTGAGGHLFFYDSAANGVANGSLSGTFIICNFVYLT